MPSESDAFLNQKPNKQTSHWITLRSLLIAAVFPFVHPVEKTNQNKISFAEEGIGNIIIISEATNLLSVRFHIVDKYLHSLII